MEAFEHMLQSWVCILQESSSCNSSQVKQSTTLISDTNLKCHPAPPDGSRVEVNILLHGCTQMSLPCSTIHEMSYPPTALCTCLFVSNMILIYRSPLSLFLLLFHLCFYYAESCSFLCLSSIFPSSSFLVSSHISGFTSPLNSRSFLSVSELLISMYIVFVYMCNS